MMHFWGMDTPQDHRMAFELYQEAAESNFLPAWRNLAAMYLYGHGVEKCESSAKYITEFCDRLEAEEAQAEQS